MKIRLPKNNIILTIAIILFILANFVLQIIKYKLYLYNALDLAIFNNVFYNLTHFGSWFSSVQGHSYLADHFAPALFVYLPFYSLFNHPLTLLLLQTLTLALSSLAVYKVSNTFIKLKINKQTKFWNNLPLIISVAWLINPLLWNINLFEFHIIPLALPLILLCFNYYLTNNFKLFTLFLILGLLVREDIALVMLMFGILAIIDKKPWRFRIAPIILSISYFWLALIIINTASPDSYRFFTYYAWLGSTPLTALENIFLKPQVWLLHIFSLANIDMLVGLLFPFLFLPLKKPKYLLLALLPFAQFILSRAGGSNIIVQTHYAVYFLPALLIASLDAVVAIYKNQHSRWWRLINFDLALSKIIIIALLILTFLGFSPLAKIAASKTSSTYKQYLRIQLEQYDNSQSLAASYDIASVVSSRSDVYATYYLFTGYQQYSQNYYKPRQILNKIIIGNNDYITYWLKLSSLPDGPEIFHKQFNAWQDNLKDYVPITRPDHPWFWTLKPDNNHDYFTQISKGCHLNELSEYYEISCHAQEPNQAIYFLQISNNNSQQAIIPFVWREKSEQGYDIFTKFYLNKNNWLVSPEINLVKITGQIELGPWLNVINKIYKLENIETLPINFN